MLGRYDNFPQNVHRIDTFVFSIPTKSIQIRVIQTLHDLNQKAVVSEAVDHQALRDCTVVLETGVAESRSFNYLDETEVLKLQKAIKKNPLGIIDLFLAACYYRTKDEKKSPLKFDYFLVRAAFLERSLELRIFHERGPRYISPEDVGSLLAERINKSALRKILRKA